MIDWQASIIELGDRLLGWTLGWPRDLTLLVVAALTAATLLTIRRLFGSQDRLRRVAQDDRRLRRLAGEARSRGDSAAVDRHRHVRKLVAGRRLRSELVPALVGLIPALLVVTWGARRLDLLPLSMNEQFEFSVTLPASSVGSVAHVVPQPGLSAEEGWVRVIELASDRDTPLGHASWRMRATPAGIVDQMTVRFQDVTLEHPLGFDARSSPRPTIAHSEDVQTRLHLATYRPYGFVPPVAALRLRPWLVGLLGLMLAFYLGAKRALRLP